MKRIAYLWVALIAFTATAQDKNNAKTFSHTVSLDSSKEQVWEALTDFSNFKQWDEMIVDVKCPDELKKNEYCKAIVSAGKMYDVEIEEIVENESYTLRHKLSSGNIYVKRELVPGDALAFTETVWYKGLSKKTFEKYKGADYDAAVKNRVLKFKAYVENNMRTGK